MTAQTDRRTGRPEPTTADLSSDLGPGLPGGIIEYATALLGETKLGSTVDGNVADQLAGLALAPQQLDDTWPTPPDPVPVGDGWVHAEIIEDDRPLFEALVVKHSEAGPEAVATACQDARLPVCPYRRRHESPGVQVTAGVPTTTPGAGQMAQAPRADGVLVVDLTTHWAGPLATKLLAESGATVIKIDPSCRPDGFGDRPAVYQHLNGHKEIIDLDLRSERDRSRFERLIGKADLLVESFSRRVLSNLGYPGLELRRLKPALSTVSIKAFQAGRPEENWLAYGPGVHAAEGLAAFAPSATRCGLVPLTTPLAYPDFLTGIAAYVTALDLLAPNSDGIGRDVEVAMAQVIGPLSAAAPVTATSRPDTT